MFTLQQRQKGEVRGMRADDWGFNKYCVIRLNGFPLQVIRAPDLHLYTHMHTLKAICGPAGSGQFPEFICLESVSTLITYNFNLFTSTNILDKCIYSQRVTLLYYYW